MTRTTHLLLHFFGWTKSCQVLIDQNAFFCCTSCFKLLLSLLRRKCANYLEVNLTREGSFTTTVQIDLTSVTGDKPQIHLFFLLVRVEPLIMPVTGGMFLYSCICSWVSICIWVFVFVYLYICICVFVFVYGDYARDSWNVFRIYPWHSPLLPHVSPHAPYGVEHFKNHSGRSSAQSSTAPSVPPACMMGCQSGALRSRLLSLTRMMRISSPIHKYKYSNTNTQI